ncbi:hypothetical protein FIBSPDRAFT_889133, partial [Athelia psychrophila]
ASALWVKLASRQKEDVVRLGEEQAEEDRMVEDESSERARRRSAREKSPEVPLPGPQSSVTAPKRASGSDTSQASWGKAPIPSPSSSVPLARYPSTASSWEPSALAPNSATPSAASSRQSSQQMDMTMDLWDSPLPGAKAAGKREPERAGKKRGQLYVDAREQAGGTPKERYVPATFAYRRPSTEAGSSSACRPGSSFLVDDAGEDDMGEVLTFSNLSDFKNDRYLSGLPSFYESPEEAIEMEFWTVFIPFMRAHSHLEPKDVYTQWKRTPQGRATPLSSRVRKFVALIIDFMYERRDSVLEYLQFYYTDDAHTGLLSANLAYDAIMQTGDNV